LLSIFVLVPVLAMMEEGDQSSAAAQLLTIATVGIAAVFAETILASAGIGKDITNAYTFTCFFLVFFLFHPRRKCSNPWTGGRGCS